MLILKTALVKLIPYPLVLSLTLLLFTNLSVAQELIKGKAGKVEAETTVSAELEKKILGRLREGRPGLQFTDLKPSPVNGLYQVKINGQFAFVSADGGHLIAGEMYEVRKGGMVNLQELERQREQIAFEPQRAKLVQSVSDEDLVVYSPKTEKKGHAYVFTDIDCGFCRRLHSRMDSYLAKGIEIRYLAFPRAGVNSNSGKKLITTWCANDSTAVMDDFKSGKNVALAECDNHPVAQHYALGQRAGVSGTPAIVLESGKLIPGAISAEELAQAMGI